jgi:hypothetical protein
MLTKKLSICLAAMCCLVSTQKAEAFLGCFDDCNWFRNDCCDPCDSPYAAGKWNIGFQGGVDYTQFTRRGVSTTFGPGIVASQTELGRFSRGWDLPWTVGVSAGYMVCDNVELFLEGDYVSAEGRRHHRSGLLTVGSSTSSGGFGLERFSRYEDWEFYVGSRYYFCPFWDCFTPFLGAKLGGQYHHRIHVRSEFDLVGISSSSSSFSSSAATAYRGNTTVAAGFQGGINYDINCNLAIVLKGEVVVSGCWDNDTRLGATTPGLIGGTTTLFGNTGPVVSYPVTLGLRYTW